MSSSMHTELSAGQDGSSEHDGHGAAHPIELRSMVSGTKCLASWWMAATRSGSWSPFMSSHR